MSFVVIVIVRNLRSGENKRTVLPQIQSWHKFNQKIMQSSSLNKNSSQGAQAILNFYRKTEDTISKTYFWLLNVYNVESERREHGKDYYEKRGRCRQ